LVVVVLYLSIVPRGWAIGLLATKGVPLRIAADREKGKDSWRQVWLPAQSLPRRHFRRALRAFICAFCTRVCIYLYVCMCADMMYVYICMCVCACFRSEGYMHFTGVLGTSAWAGVYVTQVCFNTNVHICEHTRCRLCTYVYMCICVYMHAYAYRCVFASMILLDALRRCC